MQENGQEYREVEHGEVQQPPRQQPPRKEWFAESYAYQSRHVWPVRGQHILAQYDADSVVVYQAFRAEIAQYALLHKAFVGCPLYNPTRMTWIKTNFLWMMYRSNWASQPRQDHILAIWIRRERFDYYLACARKTGSAQGETGTVRLQWDPDHFPNGDPHPHRRAVQLGLRGIESFSDGSDIVDIVDITAHVHAQAQIVSYEGMDGLLVASERVYVPLDARAAAAIDLAPPPSSLLES